MVKILDKEDIRVAEGIDEIVDSKAFRYIMYQLYFSLICTLSMASAALNKSKHFGNHKVLLLDLCLVVIMVVLLLVNRLHFYSSIKRVIIENRGIIYSSTSIAITDDYAYIKGIRPIKVRITN